MDKIKELKELMKKREEYKEEFFNADKYVIKSFIQDYDIIFYVYDSALGTAKLQGQDTAQLVHIIKELNRYKGKKILSILINPVKGKGDSIIVLTDPEMENIIGIYKKPNNRLGYYRP